MEGRRPSSDYAWFGALMAEHYAGDDTNVRTLAGGHPGRLRGDQRRGLRGSRPTPSCAARSTRPSAAATSSAPTRRWSSCSTTSRPTASRTTSSPAAAATSCGRSARTCTASPASGSSAAAARSPTPATSRAARSPTSPRPTTSTTAPRSRCGSGTAPAGARCSPPATPTATSRCSSSPTTPTSRRCGCSCFTTTPSASSTTPAGAEQALERAASRRLDRRQHQERLDHRLLTCRRCLPRAVPLELVRGPTPASPAPHPRRPRSGDQLSAAVYDGFVGRRRAVLGPITCSR